jgi:conjugative transposon TraN protein
MKNINLFFLVLNLMQSSYCQMIQVTTDKTSSLVFPYPITHIDRGTKNILTQSVKETANILMVKAAAKDFPPTNLSVVTADGSIYSFPVTFVQDPKLFVYRIEPLANRSVSTLAYGILDNPPTVRGVNDKNWGIEGSVIGIYIQGNYIYYQVKIENNSPIDYDNDFIRFYIRDKKIGKRTAVQENELKPMYGAGNISKVMAGSTGTIVTVFEKFTLPGAKFLAIEINEKNGGRHLFMKVKNNRIIKALPLPDLSAPGN